MEPLVLYGIHVAIYALIPLYIGALGPSERTTGFYIAIASVLFAGGFIGQIYSIELSEGLIISGGNWAYAALMLYTFLAIVSKGDVQIVRNVIGLVIAVNIVTYLFFQVVTMSLDSENAVNPFGTSHQVFELSTYLVVLGGVLIVMELMIILATVEWLKAHVSNRTLQLGLYPVIYTAILCLDGSIYPLILVGLSPELTDVVIGNVLGKFVTAIGLGAAMMLYLVMFSDTTKQFLEIRIPLKEVFLLFPNRFERALKEKEEVLKLSEDQLRVLAERLTLATSSAGIGIWEIEPESGQVIWDERAREIYGFEDRTDVTLSDWLGCVVEQDQIEVATSLRQEHAPEQSIDVTFQARRQNDNKIVTVEVQANRLNTSKGYRILGFVRDVTQQTELQNTNQSLQTQLIQTQKMDSIGKFAGGIAHDFNNLLIPIMGYAELSSITDSEDDKQKHLDEIMRAADRARVLIRQLMAFGRKQVFETHTQDLNEILGGISGLVERLTGENVRLRLKYSDEPAWISADRGQIEQILMNLAANARDAIGPNGELTIHIETLQTPTKPIVKLSVSDDGIGMDEGTLKHIFEPFFSTKSAASGTGLGLAMVKGIVDQHQAEIRVTSEVGKGTLVTIEFPAVAEPEGETTDTLKESQDLTGSESIIVVEDDDSVREILSKTLTLQGYKVTAISTAKELLGSNLVTEANTDLLLTDVVMPEVSGPELYHQLRTKYPSLKAIYMSGYTGGYLPDDDVPLLEKPFSGQDLHRLVRKTLNQN